MNDLPSLTEVPYCIEKLVKGMLEIDPRKRLSAEESASICQVLLWAPKSWINGDLSPSSQEILQWVMTMATKVIYECKFSNSLGAKAEYEMVLTFLSRLTIQKIKQTLSWINE